LAKKGGLFRGQSQLLQMGGGRFGHTMVDETRIRNATWRVKIEVKRLSGEKAGYHLNGGWQEIGERWGHTDESSPKRETRSAAGH